MWRGYYSILLIFNYQKNWIYGLTPLTNQHSIKRMKKNIFLTLNPFTKTSHKAHVLQPWDVVRPPLGGVINIWTILINLCYNQFIPALLA